MNMGQQKVCQILLIALITLAASSARAEETTVEGSGPLYERGGLFSAGIVLGIKAGAGLSQPFGDLGSSFITELELGYNLPVLDRSFELFVAGAYTQPSAEGTLTDERLPGPIKYSIKQQQAMVTLGLLYRVPLATDRFRPYLSAGPRLFAMRSEAKGSGGDEAFGQNEETATKLGVFAAVGGELQLGPGALLLEVSMSWAKLDAYVLRDTSTGALGLSLGYRFFL
jgi:hypothetical protein